MPLTSPPWPRENRVNGRASAQLALITELKAGGYRFVTPTNATHRRILAREDKRRARDLRDVFGWNLPFEAGLAGARLLEILSAAGALETGEDGLLRSCIRVATLGKDLFLHSAFPPKGEEAIFFGPDSYRFANFLAERLSGAASGGVLVDIGSGSGVGAVAAARICDPGHIILTDLNPRALEFARANLVGAGVKADRVVTRGLEGIGDNLDLVLANPPFIAGDGGRIYRDGGDLFGARVSLDWAIAAARRLAIGGRLLLYTGSAIVDGADPFYEALKQRFDDGRFQLVYREIDPDIFGSELARPAYAQAERIAAVGLDLKRVA